MKISYNWLKQFLQLDWEASKTGALLTTLGLEIEGISSFESIKGGLEGIVVGHILSCAKHPNADTLQLTMVDIGLDEPVQIVCGATNIEKGHKVPVATIGTTLYTRDGEAWVIKKSKIRGAESNGMLCAEDELGLGDNHDGIMILNEELVSGTPCTEVFKIEKDQVFEIGLTPNRADAMSHYGVARDLKAGLIQNNIKAVLRTPSTSNFNLDNRSLKIDVIVENEDLAPRYCGVTLSGLIVQPSPDWLKNRLRSIGLKPVNNVVDATNYVLHELGQPLHAFDADRIHGKKIVVKKVKKGTRFVTLDGEHRTLHEEDLMICDGEKPMCIAGIFGGINTGVTEDTTSIFLESAYFDPVSIRKTAKRHGLNTDASFRFERGIDINNVEYCLKRAAVLIKEIAGGYITSDIVDLFPKKPKDYEVFLSFNKIDNLVGQEIPRDTMKSILFSLDIQVKNMTESGMGLAIPFYRVDVQREVDVIEEILRVYGYDNINIKEKLSASIAPTSKFEDYKLQNVVGTMLASQGFYEILNNSLSNPDYSDYLKRDKGSEAVTILNPLNKELSVLRTSMLFNGLETIAYNSNRQNPDLKLFEFGKTYHTENSERIEEKHLSLLITGKRNEEQWSVSTKNSDFFYLKSMAENVLRRLGISDYSSTTVTPQEFTEGITFKKGKHELVRIGLIKGEIIKKFDIKQGVLFADFRWDHLVTLASTNSITVKPIAKYPEVKRDFALLLDEHITFNEVHNIATQTEKKLLTDISLFDVYTGKNLPDGKKSYAVSFTLQDTEGTLTDSQIDKIMQKLQLRYEKDLGAQLR